MPVGLGVSFLVLRDIGTNLAFYGRAREAQEKEHRQRDACLRFEHGQKKVRE